MSLLVPTLGETRWLVERMAGMPKGMGFRVAQVRYEPFLGEPGGKVAWYYTNAKSHYFGSSREANAAWRVLQGEG